MAQFQGQLRDTRELMGKALSAMRETGLAMAQAAASGRSVGELQEKFDKERAEFEQHKGSADRLEILEREGSTIVNGVNGTGREIVPQKRGEQHAEALRETFMAYVRYGERSSQFGAAMEGLGNMTPMEKHALLGTQGHLGGFLVPEDFRAEIVKNLAGYAIVRGAGARVVQTSSSTLVYPSIAGGQNPYATGFTGSWRAEGSQGTDGSAPATQNQPTFGQERVPIHIWQPNAVVVTPELMMDSVISLDSLIAQVIAETKALDEDAAFLRGTGIGQPKGVLSYAATAVATRQPGAIYIHQASVAGGDLAAVANGGVGYNSLMNAMFALYAQYRQRASWFMNSATFAKILQLKDSYDRPLLYENALPMTLFGHKVFISELMPDLGANTDSVFFGDMNYYCIAERMDLRVQRLEERFAPNVGFLPTARAGGGVLRTDAFVIYRAGNGT